MKLTLSRVELLHPGDSGRPVNDLFYSVWFHRGAQIPSGLLCYDMIHDALDKRPSPRWSWR